MAAPRIHALASAQSSVTQIDPGQREVLCVFPGVLDPEICTPDDIPSQVLPGNTTMHELSDLFAGQTSDKHRIVFEHDGIKYCGCTTLQQITSERLVVLQGVKCPISGIRLQAQGEGNPYLEQDVQRSLKLLHEFDRILLARNFTSKTKWAKRSAVLNKSRKCPPVVVGIIGASGAGKSTIAECLVDTNDLLPRDSLESCTSGHIDISYSGCKSMPYRAAVSWASRLEVLEMLEQDLNDILVSINDPELGFAEAKQSEAWGRLGELFPHIEPVVLQSSTKDDLFRLLAALEHFFGSTKNEEQETADGFGQKVEELLMPKFDYVYQGRQYTGKAWPLVKARSIEVPSEVLSRGVTIRDMAGVGEKNAYRANAHKTDSLACSVLLVVTPAIRACSESDAHDLMNNAMQRQARRDGNLLSLWFATSQKDNMTVDDATWRKLGLDREHGTYQEFMNRTNAQREQKENAVKDASARLNELRDARSEIQQQLLALMTPPGSILGKRKSDEVNKSDSDQEDGRETETQHLQRQLVKLNEQFSRCDGEKSIAQADLVAYNNDYDTPARMAWLLCVRKRDEIAAIRLKETFDETMRTSNMSKTAISDEASRIPSECGIRCFMTSASEYQNLRSGRASRFRDEEDTGIPGLRRACFELPEEVQHKWQTNVASNHLHYWNMAVDWCQSDKASFAQLSAQIRQEEENAMQVKIQEIRDTALEGASVISEHVRIEAASVIGLIKSFARSQRDQMPQLVNNWSKWRHNSLLAAIRRNGRHTTASGSVLDMLADFDQLFWNSDIESKWREIFGRTGTVKHSIRTLRTDLTGHTDTLRSTFQPEGREKAVKTSYDKELSDMRRRYTQKLLSYVDEFEERIQTCQQDANRGVLNSLLDSPSFSEEGEMSQRDGTLSRMFLNAMNARNGGPGAQERVVASMKNTLRDDKNRIVNGVVNYMHRACDEGMTEAYKHFSRRIDRWKTKLEQEVTELYTAQNKDTVREELKARLQVRELLKNAGLLQDRDAVAQVKREVKIKQESRV